MKSHCHQLLHQLLHLVVDDSVVSSEALFNAQSNIAVQTVCADTCSAESLGTVATYNAFHTFAIWNVLNEMLLIKSGFHGTCGTSVRALATVVRANQIFNCHDCELVT